MKIGTLYGGSAEILADLEGLDRAPKAVRPGLQNMQLTLFEAEHPEVVRQLQSLDVNLLTPLQALQVLDGRWPEGEGMARVLGKIHVAIPLVHGHAIAMATQLGCKSY